MQKINGHEYLLQGKKLVEFLNENNFELTKIAIEYNGTILPKVKWTEQVLCDGDKIEIVSFVGGG